MKCNEDKNRFVIETLDGCKFFHNGINTACSIKVFHICFTCGSKVTKVRCSLAYCVSTVKAEFNTCLMCNCR